MRVGRRVYALLTGVLAIAVLPFGVLAQTSTNQTGSLVLRILQIVWIAASVVSFGIAIYGFVQMRRMREDLLEYERSKRIVLISGIAFIISLLLLGLITFLLIRSNRDNTIAPPAAETVIEGGFGGLLGPTSAIAQHYPVRDQRNVPRNTPILITFKQEITLSSVDGGQGVLNNKAVAIQQLQADDKPQGDLLSAHVSMAQDKTTLKIVPDQLLGSADEPSTKYKVTIFPTVQNSQRTSMLGGTGTYSWVFYVGTSLDNAPAYVVSVFPSAGKDVSPRNALTEITFSKAIDPTTVKNTTVIVNDAISGTPINGSLSIMNNYRTIVFTPNEMCGSNACNQRMYCMPGNHQISVRLKTASVRTPREATLPNAAASPFDGVVDVLGNALDGGGQDGIKKDGISQGTKEDDYLWTFTTSNAMDTTMPTILSVIPGRNGTRVDVNAPVEIHFSKIMDIGSLNQSSIVLDKGLQYWIDSDLDLAKKQTISKIFHDPFKENMSYSPEVHGQLRDIYQNCFASCAGPLQ